MKGGGRGPGINLGALKKTKKNCSHSSHCPSRDSKRSPLQWNSEALPLWDGRSVALCRITLDAQMHSRSTDCACGEHARMCSISREHNGTWAWHVSSLPVYVHTQNPCSWNPFQFSLSVFIIHLFFVVFLVHITVAWLVMPCSLVRRYRTQRNFLSPVVR